MLKCHTVSELRKCLEGFPNQKIGFVPTMGNLHAGHLRLVEIAKQKADCVVVSIYVNPMQFGKNEDFNDYPRTLQTDLDKLKQLGVDLVFTPDNTSMYPQGVEQSSYVEVPDRLVAQLEGAQRPGHFRGVTTIVNKLFNIVQPDIAIFGEKDFQQLKAIQQMVADLNMPIIVHGEPTVRAADGLALSSRNQYLTTTQRKQAAMLYDTLEKLRERILLENMDLTDLEQAAILQLEQKGFDPDYVAIRNSDTLQEAASTSEPLIILAAARLGKTRLLDNLRV